MRLSRQNVLSLLNVAVAVNLLPLCLVLAGAYFGDDSGNKPSHARSGNRSGISTGTKVALEGIDWGGSVNLLFLLDEGCGHCVDSVSFYREIAHGLKGRKDVRLFAILSKETESSREFIGQLGFSLDGVKFKPLHSIGAESTPTLALLDDEGVIMNLWVGKLTERQEVEVLNTLGVQTDGRSLKFKDRFINETDLERLINEGGRVSIVDLRDRIWYARGHFPNSKNIPVDELEVRGINELPLSDTIVIYGDFDTDRKTEAADTILRKEGFARVLTLQRGINYPLQD